MLTFEFTTDDLARTRFAISPMWEVIAGLRLLRAPDRAGPHLPWVKQSLPIAAELDLGTLLALVPGRGYIPDFLSPPPSSPIETFEDELERVRSTPADVVRGDVRQLIGNRRPSGRPGDLLDDPSGALPALADSLRVWWQRALEPHWARVQSVLEADLAYRARRLTDGGPTMLFSDLDRETAWRGGELVVDMPWEGREALQGRGLVIVPSAFGWERSFALAEEIWQPTLFYPARGLELLWEPGEVATDALAGVIGRSRADLIIHLDAPRSTTELARRLSLTPGGVSQHLMALRAAGLVSATRRGREVLYLRTDLAERLRAASP